MPDPMIDEVQNTIRETVACMIGQPWQNADGGIGREPGMHSDVWSTSEALILANAIDNVAHLLPNAFKTSAVGEMKDFILKAQQHDGNWASDEVQADVVGTTLALMAMRRWQDEPDVRKAVEKAIGWLARVQGEDGGWPVWPTASGKHVSTAFPTLHAYEAIGVWFLDNVGDIVPAQSALNDARTWLYKARGSGSLLPETPGLPPSARHTAYQVLVNGSVGQLNVSQKDVIEWLEQEQHTNDGTWGMDISVGDVESTAAVVRALLLLGVSPKERNMRAAINALLERWSEGQISGKSYKGWLAKPGGQSDGKPTSYTTYYALMALLDYLKAVRARTGRPKIRVRRWQKILSPALAVLTIAAALFTIVAAADSIQAISAGLTTLVGVATIVTALPILLSWARKK